MAASCNGGFLHRQHMPYRRLLYLRLTNQRSQRLTPIDGTAGRDDPNWVGAGELEYLAEAVVLQTRTLGRARGIDDLGVLVDLDAQRSGRFIHGRFGHGAKDGSTESPIPEERGPRRVSSSVFDCDANVMAGGRQGACTARCSDSVNP